MPLGPFAQHNALLSGLLTTSWSFAQIPACSGKEHMSQIRHLKRYAPMKTEVHRTAASRCLCQREVGMSWFIPIRFELVRLQSVPGSSFEPPLSSSSSSPRLHRRSQLSQAASDRSMTTSASSYIPLPATSKLVQARLIQGSVPLLKRWAQSSMFGF